MCHCMKTINMDTNSKILQKIDEILSYITRLDQVFKSTSYHPTIQGNKCQGYGHVAVNCPTPVKITKVKKLPVTNPEPLPPLLPTPSVVVCSGRQHLPPLLPTSSPVRVVIDKLHVTNTKSDSELTRLKNQKTPTLTKRTWVVILRNPVFRVHSK